MSKIDRLDLIGLKKRFEEIDASSASKMKGKTHYYNRETGSFLGQIGDTGTLKFVTTSEFYFALSTGNENAGCLFSSLNGSEQTYFLKQFLPYGANVDIEFNAQQIMGWGSVDGQFTKFYYNPYDVTFGDIKDFKNSMYHEIFHYENNHHGSTFENESSAFNAMIEDSSYKDTTSAHKYDIACLLYKLWKSESLNETPGYTWEDACDKCKCNSNLPPPY